MKSLCTVRAAYRLAGPCQTEFFARLSHAETWFDEGFAEVRTELRTFRSNLVILTCGFVFLLLVLTVLGVIGR